MTAIIDNIRATAALGLAAALFLAASTASADDLSVADLVEEVRDAVVVVTFTGRDGEQQGLGSGFVVDSSGLIATNLHAIGEARPIAVRFADGRRFDIIQIYATDRVSDVVLLRIDAKDLPVLKIADAPVRQGESVVAIGNPLGLEHSVVTGIVSAVRREIAGVPMIQLAIPVERGNSGGPVLNRQGEVIGLLTLKSLEAENLGYAVSAATIAPLLEQPNPVPIDRWLTIGRLNSNRWEADPNVSWRRRSGEIIVSGQGTGFGGRSLCLSTAEIPEGEHEIAVDVRLDEADGAAGLVFHSDGEDRHYGFYPSSGGMRFVRFDGPTVYSWTVLRDERVDAYRPGEWNRLRVRISGTKFTCYCNEEEVFRVQDGVLAPGAAGLVKFRHTTAAFKNFAVGADLATPPVSEELLAAVRTAGEAPEDAADVLDEVDAAPAAVQRAIDAEIRALEKRAERLRMLSQTLHEERIRRRLAELFEQPEEEIDLAEAALLVAALDNPELDVQAYLEEIDALAAELTAALPENATAEQKYDVLREHVFSQWGFHGSRTNYYHAANSYLNAVIDDREGLPITLSVLYIELARRIGLQLDGVGLPGHFVVKRPLDGDEYELIDVFARGEVLSRAEAIERVRAAGHVWSEEYLEPQSKRDIVLRLLRNLINLANVEEDAEQALRYVNAILVLDRESLVDRMFRAMLYYNTNQIEAGLADVEWILERENDAAIVSRVRQLQEMLQRRRR